SEVRLAEPDGDRRARREPVEHIREELSQVGAVHEQLTDHDARGLGALANIEGHDLEGDALVARLLEPLTGRRPRVELVARTRDQARGSRLVDLYALLALGRETKGGLGLDSIGGGKGTYEHLAVADFD